MCNGTANKFHKVMLHGETLVLVTTATVAEVENGSTFGETCLATEVQKCFTKPTMLHGATQNMFRNAVAHKFQLKVSTCNSGFKGLII